MIENAKQNFTVNPITYDEELGSEQQHNDDNTDDNTEDDEEEIPNIRPDFKYTNKQMGHVMSGNKKLHTFRDYEDDEEDEEEDDEETEEETQQEKQIRIQKVKLEEVYKKRISQIVKDVKSLYTKDIDEYTLEDIQIQKEFLISIQKHYSTHKLIIGKQTPLQIIADRFFREQLANKFVVLDLSCDVKLEILEGESQLRIKLIDYIPTNILKDISNINAIWITQLTINDIQTNIVDTFEISCNIPGSEKIIFREKFDPRSKFIGNQNDHKIFHSDKNLVDSGGCYGSIKRDELWALTLCGKDCKFIESFIDDSNSNDEFTFLEKNTFTIILINILLESVNNIPKNIMDHIHFAYVNSDIYLYKFQKKGFEIILNFIEPFLKEQTFMDIELFLTKFNCKKWLKELDGRHITLQFNFTIICKSDSSNSLQKIEESYIGVSSKLTNSNKPNVWSQNSKQE